MALQSAAARGKDRAELPDLVGLTKDLLLVAEGLLFPFCGRKTSAREETFLKLLEHYIYLSKLDAFESEGGTGG